VLKRYDKLEPDSQRVFINEIEILSKLRHPNVVLYLGHFIEDNFFTIVTEEMKDNLLDLLEDFSIHLSVKKKLEISIEICKAMIYLHSLNKIVLHRDLKAENILINQFNEIKICDFGISKRISKEQDFAV